jgi:tetratricopeptide (TPR) repeat protein
MKVSNSFFSIPWSYKQQALTIGFLAFIAYFNTLQHGFVLDDDVALLQNNFVQEGISGIPKIFSHGYLYGFNQKNDQSYRPMVLMQYAVIKSLFGNKAQAYHLMNILYYILACLLLFFWLNALFKHRYKGMAFWACILFTLHPVHTEVVANVKSADELLHFIFAMACLIYFLKYFDCFQKSHLALSLLFFFLALLSKESALSLLLIAPLSVYFFNEIKVVDLFKHSWTFLIVAFVYLGLRNIVLDTVTFEEQMSVINNGLAAAQTYSEQLATTFYIFSEYLKLLFFPHPLAWDYSFPHFQIVTFSHWRVFLTVITLSLAVIAAMIGIQKKSIFSFCFFFFCAAFALTSNFFILIGSTLGERFLFFPSIAWVIFLPAFLFYFINRLQLSDKVSKKLFYLFLALYSVGFLAKTIDRNQDWKSNETLFTSGAKAVPRSSRAQAALGSVYRERAEQSTQTSVRNKNFDLAILYYQKSLSLFEENANAWYNLGVTYMGMGKQQSALKAYQKAISIDPKQINAWNNLGVIYFQNGDYQQAENFFQECLKLNKNFQNAYANLGAVAHNMGRYEQARKYYLKALELNPHDQNSRKNLNQLPLN